MKIRYMVFFGVFVLQNIFCFYYIICFFDVYEEIFMRWLISCFMSFVTGTCIDLAYPLIATLLRILAIKTKIQ